MKKEIKRKGRRSALEALRKAMRGEEGEGLKKVTVAAPDEEGLKAGLDMAKSKIDEMKEIGEEHDHDHDEDSEESDDSKEELSEMSKEELIEMIKDLK